MRTICSKFLNPTRYFRKKQFIFYNFRLFFYVFNTNLLKSIKKGNNIYVILYTWTPIFSIIVI